MAEIDMTKANEKGEWVEIPEFDMYDHPHPKVQINRMEFLAGNKYKLIPKVAGEVRRILHSLNQSNIRLLRPRKDQRSMNQVESSSGTGVIMDRQDTAL